ncbi:hypothetical protein Tco_1142793 [Tanacetum coccineum]
MSNSNTNLQTQTSSVLQNDTVSSCSISNIQEKTQLSRSRCMHSLKEIKSLFKFLSETLQDFESSGTESEVQDDSSRSWNDTNADDADIRPIYDEEPTAAECNIFAI